MEYLLCNFKSNELIEVTNHYIIFHKVDLKNEFFKKIFQEGKNVFHKKRCVICQEFLPKSKFKRNHHFLKHYENGRNVVEEKPISITNIGIVQRQI